MKVLELNRNGYSFKRLSEMNFDAVDVHGDNEWHVRYLWQSGTEEVFTYDQSSGREDFKTVPCYEEAKVDVLFTDDVNKNAEILIELIDKYLGEYQSYLNRGKK